MLGTLQRCCQATFISLVCMYIHYVRQALASVSHDVAFVLRCRRRGFERYRCHMYVRMAHLTATICPAIVGGEITYELGYSDHLYRSVRPPTSLSSGEVRL